MNPGLPPRTAVDIRTACPGFFRKWQNVSGLDAPPFHRGKNGEVVLDFGGGDMLASADGG